ncbi:uncharacterized protein C2orf81 homolog [Rhinophrynus dorsalis]
MSKGSSITRGGREATAQAMSRVSQSKSRAEKSRAVTVAPLPQVTVDIMPGRFTEDEWISFVTLGDGEDAVGEIIDSLLSRVMDECFQIYLRQQMIPYTISQARDAMVQVVEWTFVPRDEGEGEVTMDRTWLDGEEPRPCPTDSWAQGCVPVTQAALTPRSKPTQTNSEEPISETPEQEASASDSEPLTMSTSEPSNPSPNGTPPTIHGQTPELREETRETQEMTSTTQTSPLILQPTPPTQPAKNKRPYRPYRGPLRSAGLKDITKSLDETEKEMLREQFPMMNEEEEEDRNLRLLPTSLHNILRIQLGRPPQKKGVIYDYTGNVLSMPKLDPSRLPRHNIRPQVEVLDPTKETECKEKEALRTGGPRENHQSKRHKAPKDRAQLIFSSIDSQEQMLVRKSFNPSTTGENSKGPIPLTEGILLDTMQLTNGVILRDGNNTKRGSLHSLQQREHLGREENRELKPIQASVTLPSISVEQLIKNHTPQVRPISTLFHLNTSLPASTCS